jgi:hypothetical protein
LSKSEQSLLTMGIQQNAVLNDRYQAWYLE